MLVVSYLANYNGMASWCWEAAHALQEIGQPVLLVCSEEVKLPGNPAVKILRFNPNVAPQSSQRKNVLSQIKREIANLSDKPDAFLSFLHQQIQDQGIQPSAYFLNMPSLQDPSIDVPQYIVGWAYPTSLKGYLGKITKSEGWNISKKSIRAGLNYLGWWRKDLRGYKDATSVLAVSHKLGNELKSQGIKTHVVHPGTLVVTKVLSDRDSSRCKLIMAAENLEDPRKRVKWMVKALKSGSKQNFTLTLVGEASSNFRQWVCNNKFPAEFLGQIPRYQLQNLMAQHDVFLFGSRLDDWGYVLVEAMGQGLCIVAPKLSPFDEIVGNSGFLYSLNSSQEFSNTVDKISQSNLLVLRQVSWNRANNLFSRHVFGHSLLAAYTEK